MSKQLSILLIEDNPADAVLLRELMGEADPGRYEITWEKRLSTGLGRLGGDRFDVIMLDLTLPDSKGMATFERTLQAADGIPIVILTGLEDEKLGVEAIEKGAQDYIVKGQLSPASLARCVRYAIERYARLEVETKLRAREEEIRVAKLKQAFIEVASHELRTPLTILLGMTQLARRTPDLEPSLSRWLDLIARAGTRLDRVVDQIVTMLMEGKVSGVESRVSADLGDLLRGAAEHVASFVEQRHQTLSIDVPDDLDSVVVDREKIQDSVANLLINAIKFTPDGGDIQLSARRQNGSVSIVVADQGMGIDERNLPHIFDPFFTGFDVTKHSSGLFEYGAHGVGLGLTLVKLFVEMHSGVVDVDSRLGEGSTFTVTLPAEGS